MTLGELEQRMQAEIEEIGWGAALEKRGDATNGERHQGKLRVKEHRGALALLCATYVKAHEATSSDTAPSLPPVKLPDQGAYPGHLKPIVIDMDLEEGT
jgi:hypothetical protein